MGQLPHLAAEILGQRLMIEPVKLRAVLAVIGPRLGIPGPAMPQLLQAYDARFAIVTDPRDAATAEHRRLMDAEYRRGKAGGWGFSVDRGIAVVDISGGLTNRISFDMDASTELRSYESIRSDLVEAAKAPDVKGILLRMDTPGGAVAGAFDLADLIAKVNREKTVWAVTDDAAFSAGYLLASQAKRAFVSQTGGLGSIGVLMVHVEFSEMLAAAGITVTTLYEGDRKNDFSDTEPLSEGARKVAKNLLQTDYRMFVDAVGRSGRLSAEAAKATEAGLFFGAAAVEAKLANAVVNFPAALADMQKTVGAGQQVFTFAEGAAPQPAATSVDIEPAAGPAGAPVPTEDFQPEGTGRSDEEDTAMAEQVTKPEASSSPPVDVDAVRAEAKKAGYADAAEVVELCVLAGKPELAAGFVRDSKSAKEVRAALINGAAEAAAKQPQVSSHARPGAGIEDIGMDAASNPLIRACESIAKQMKGGVH